MNININNYLEKLCPLLWIIFIAFFVNTLIYFILPKRGIDYINKSNMKSSLYKNENTKNSYESINKTYIIKAIYKSKNEISWVILENIKTGKTLYEKEGNSINGNLLFKIKRHEVVFKNKKGKFRIPLKLDNKDINHLINNGDKK